jgi:hypothetical protein
MQSFKARSIRFRGSEAPITSFTQACDVLQGGLIGLLGLIEKQRGACAAYEAMVRAHYKASMLGEFARLGGQWKPYAAKVKETHPHIRKLSIDIVAGVKQPTASKRGCIIM